MRSALLALVAAAVAISAAPALAETGKGDLRVSVTVVRSCRVSTDAPAVRVDCGSRPQPVKVEQPSAGAGANHGSTARPVTIEF